jgi:hypothetical protein
MMYVTFDTAQSSVKVMSNALSAFLRNRKFWEELMVYFEFHKNQFRLSKAVRGNTHTDSKMIS